MRTLGRAALAALALAAAVAAGPAVPGRTPRGERWDPAHDVVRPVHLPRLARDLSELGYVERVVDEAGGFVWIRIQGENGVFPVYLVPGPGILHFRVPRLGQVARLDPGLPRLHAVLSELNWLNLTGKYAWDARDGEVRFSYGLVCPEGLSFRTLAVTLARVMHTVDEDLATLRAACRPGVTGDPDKP